MTAIAPSVPQAAVLHPGDGHPVRAFGNEILLKLGARQTAGALSLGLATVPAGNGGPPPHVHHGEDELFLILEGRYRVWVDGEGWSEAGPGSAVFLPRGVPHTFEVVDGPGRHWVVTTSGEFERYFTRVGALFAESAGGPPDRARLAAIGAEHGMEIRRPA